MQNFYRKFIYVFLFLSIFKPLLAESLEITSYVDKTKIGINEYLKLTVEISGKNAADAQNPEVPDIKNFENLGYSTSSSSSMSIINGKMTSSVTKSFIYNLKPQKIGKFIIPPITVKYKNQTYTTDPIHIEVLKETSQPPPHSSSKFHKDSNNSGQTNSEKLSDNLFIRVIRNKTQLYKGEPLVLTYYLYTRYDIENLSFEQEPNFNNFWKEDIFRAKNVRFFRKQFIGKLFNVMKLRKVALFPTKTGNFNIEPLGMNVQIRTQARSFFDFGSVKSYNIESKNISVPVQDLPETNKPGSFNGAVGDFNIESTISKNNLKAGDSFTLTLKISGEGNINQISLPDYQEIPNLRFMEPEISTSMNDDRISGEKTIKYLVIPQEKGIYEIPKLEFSYFNPDEAKYIKKFTQKFKIKVAEGDKVFVSSGIGKNKIALEGKDIKFIIENDDIENKIVYFDKIYYWLVCLILLISIPIINYIYIKKEDLAQDIDYIREKRAKKVLKKYMKAATRYAKNQNPEFYTAAQNGLSSFLADKLKIPRGSSSHDIIANLKKAKIESQVLKQVKEIFQICNQARFMPENSKRNNITKDYNLLKDAIKELSKIHIKT